MAWIFSRASRSPPLESTLRSLSSTTKSVKSSVFSSSSTLPGAQLSRYSANRSTGSTGQNISEPKTHLILHGLPQHGDLVFIHIFQHLRCVWRVRLSFHRRDHQTR